MQMVRLDTDDLAMYGFAICTYDVSDGCCRKNRNKSKCSHNPSL